MKRALLACALGAWLSSACDVATVKLAPSTIAQNQCQSSSECGGGECIDNQCRTRQGTLGVGLFEITPPANATDSAGLQFLLPKVALAPAGGDLALPLGLVSHLIVQVKIPVGKCVPSFTSNGVMLAAGTDSTIPATITITPSQRSLGISTPAAITQTVLINSSYFSASADVPSGTYDVYVQPFPQVQGCVVPPQVRRTQVFDGGQNNLAIPLPEPSSFELHVTWPAGDGALSGWLVDMLDPVSGHVISNSAQLAVGAGGKTDYVATVSYFPPVVGVDVDTSAQELLRLSPPATIDAPSILLARSALALSNPNSGRFDKFSAVPTTVKVQGQVTAEGTPRPVAANVTLVATKIIGIEPGVLASFVRTVRVEDDGQFSVPLLPGSYKVLAVPAVALKDPTSDADTQLAEIVTPWEVPSSPPVQGGKLIELNRALPINGLAVDSSGSAVATAFVEAVPSPASIQRDVLHEALGEPVVVPRASTSTVQSNGAFNLLADVGTFDISVRPKDGTGFAWSVVAAVPVGLTPDMLFGVNLDSLVSPLPVLYSGTVTVPGATADSVVAVPGARVRAYVYTVGGTYTSDPSKADSVLQVGETAADSAGNFKLLIPASLNGGAQ